MLYVFIYLPLCGLLSIIEGAIYGHWKLSEWGYQLSAFAMLILPWLLVSGLVAVPLIFWLVDKVRPSTRIAQLLWQGSAGALAVLLAFTLFNFVGGAGWWAPLLLLKFPVAFMGGAALFGVLCGHLVLSKGIAA